MVCLDIKHKVKMLRSQEVQQSKITNFKRFNIASFLNPNKVVLHKDFVPVKCYEQVKSTNNYKFIQAQSQIPSILNFTLLEKLCQDYRDYQLPFF